MEMIERKLAIGLLLALSLPGLRAGSVWAGPARLHGRDVPIAELVRIEQVDHSLWTELLGRYVVDGRIDYGSWKRSGEDVSAVDHYLATLSAGSVGDRSPRPAVLAFWINAYNALTIRVLLDEYPVIGPRQLRGRLNAFDIRQDAKLWVAGRAYSLDSIYRSVLRRQGDVRAYLAISDGSLGGPAVRSEAYTAEKCELQLADDTRRFFARDDHLRAAGRRIHVAELLDQLPTDFGRTPEERLKRLGEYLPDDARRIVAGRFELRWLKHDWRLNDAGPYAALRTLNRR